MAILHRMHECRVYPTSVTYSLLIKASVGDEKSLNDVFEDCTWNGMLDQKVENSFWNHGPISVKEHMHKTQDSEREYWGRHSKIWMG